MTRTTTALRVASRLLTLGTTLIIGACTAATAELPEPGVDGPEPNVERGHSALGAGATVADAIAGSCSTVSVKGLSEQIVAQMNCISPNAMAAVPHRANMTKSDATFAFMQSPARDALVAALDANPSKTLGVNSMFRSVAQQFVLYEWGKKKRCGIKLAAKPGSSNHESGLAIDTSQYSSWRTALVGRGFKWFGSKDKVHFDYVGSGRVNLKGVDVRAFQMLWNLNNPQDKISEDGQYGPATAARLGKSPAAGFALGASCGEPTPNPADAPETPPPSTPSPHVTSGSCVNHCGNSTPSPNSNPNCYCDSACSSAEDCCTDFDSACGASIPPTPPPSDGGTGGSPGSAAASCAGFCGSSSPVPGSDPACYCDASCPSNGDCCGDASSLCGV